MQVVPFIFRLAHLEDYCQGRLSSFKRAEHNVDHLYREFRAISLSKLVGCPADPQLSTASFPKNVLSRDEAEHG